MKTIKSYTDIAQTRKLAEILPKVLSTLIPELAEDNGDKIGKQLLNWFKDCKWDTIDNGTLKRDDIIAWLEERIQPQQECSEDEKVRKSIIKFLQVGGYMSPEDKDKAFAWLEKQKTTEEALRYLKENHSPSEMSDFQAAMNIAVAKAYNKGYTDGLEKQGEVKRSDYPYVPGWRENRPDNKPKIKHSILMLTIHGVAEGEWLGEEWCQYRWSCKIKDTEVLYWLYLSDLETLEKENVKQGEQTTDKIIEKARTEKQRILLTETNGDAHIDWDCRSLQDVKSLLKYGLEYIDAQLEKQSENNMGISEATKKKLEDNLNKALEKETPESWNESLEKQGEQKSAWGEEDEKHLLNCISYFRGITEFSPYYNDYLWLKSLKKRMQPQPKQEVCEDTSTSEYVDLGLPSGTLWKSANEEGYYTFDGAVEKFNNQLPTKEQWEELKDNCIWGRSNNGYTVTGPNNNTIFLPADGVHAETGIYDVGTDGHYWSCTNDKEGYAWDMYFDKDDNPDMYLGLRYYGRSVRLVK